MPETSSSSQEPVEKYYLVERANEPVAGIRFTPYDIIGSMLFGFYATSDPSEIEKLGEVIKTDPRRGLSEISYADFEKMAQKKIPNFSNSAHWKPRPVVTQPKESPSPTPQSPTTTASPIKGSGAVVDHNPAPPPEPEVITAAPVSSIEEALPVGEVAASPTNPPKPSRKSAKSAGS